MIGYTWRGVPCTEVEIIAQMRARGMTRLASNPLPYFDDQTNLPTGSHRSTWWVLRDGHLVEEC